MKKIVCLVLAAVMICPMIFSGCGKETPAKQEETAEAGLSAYEQYKKDHPEYTGTEEDWLNEFSRGENELDRYLAQTDLSSYTAIVSQWENGRLEYDQVFTASGNVCYWKNNAHLLDRKTGDTYFETNEFYFTVSEHSSDPETVIAYSARDRYWYLLTSWNDIVYMLDPCYVRNARFSIDPAQFREVSKFVFEADPERVNEIGKAVLWDMDDDDRYVIDGESVKQVPLIEVFDSVKLEITGDDLKITATSKIFEDPYVTVTKYEVTLTQIGVSTVTFPEYLENPFEEVEIDTIAKCYQKQNGDAINDLVGYVTAYMPAGENSYKVWITDEFKKNQIMVFFNDLGFPHGVEVGNKLFVFGVLTVDKELYVIDVYSEEDFITRKDLIPIRNRKIQQLSELSARDQSMIVDLEGVRLKKTSLSKNGFVDLTDRAGNLFSIWVAEREVEFFNRLFEGVKPGIDLNLSSLAVEPMDGEDAYLRLTELTEVGYSYGLLLSYTEKTMKTSLSLEESLSDLLVYYRAEGGDGSLTPLGKGEYTVTAGEGFDPEQSGEYEITVSYGSEKATLRLTLHLPEVKEHVSYPTLEETLIEHTGGLLMPSLPSSGDVEVLVIPIGFTNSDYEKYGSPEEIRATLETAFNGTNEETGWYSLCDYYREVSYGALNLHATILDIFNTGDAHSLYEGTPGVTDAEYYIQALSYYDDEIDFSRYDQNGDGRIDNVYLVYLAPYNRYPESEQTELWWAYNFYVYWEDTSFCYDGIIPYNFLWASYEFFDMPLHSVG